VTGETQTECESRQVRRAWELHERSGKTQLHQVFMQRHAFHTTKEVGEISWRGTDLASHVNQSHWVRELSLEKFLRASNQACSRCPSSVMSPFTFVERRPQERKNQFLYVERVYLRAATGQMQDARAQILETRTCAPGTACEQPMITQRLAISIRELRQNIQIRGDDHFGVAVRDRPAHAEGFPRATGHDLVGITNDIVASHVPDEDAAIRQADLEVRGKPFRALPAAQAERRRSSTQAIESVSRRVRDSNSHIPSLLQISARSSTATSPGEYPSQSGSVMLHNPQSLRRRSRTDHPRPVRSSAVKIFRCAP
jgi:hypothetical protein